MAACNPHLALHIWKQNATMGGSWAESTYTGRYTFYSWADLGGDTLERQIVMQQCQALMCEMVRPMVIRSNH